MMLMGFNIITLAAILLSTLSIIELALTAAVSNHYYDSPSTISFLIFCSVWSLLVLAYIVFVPRFLPRLYHALAPAALLLLTTLFWFAGAVAAADHLGVPRCHDGFCRTWQAAVAFAFFIW